MKIVISIIVAIALAFASPAFAASKLKVNLEAEHGAKLNKASFFIRFKFEKTTHIKWTSSNYKQRKTFLENYYIQKAADEKQDKLEKKQEAAKAKALARQKRDEQKKELDRAKEDARIEREEQREANIEKRNFSHTVKSRERSISDLRNNQRR